MHGLPAKSTRWHDVVRRARVRLQDQAHAGTHMTPTLSPPHPYAKWLRILPFLGAGIATVGLFVGRLSIFLMGVSIVVVTFVVARRAVRQKIERERLEMSRIEKEQAEAARTLAGPYAPSKPPK